MGRHFFLVFFLVHNGMVCDLCGFEVCDTRRLNNHRRTKHPIEYNMEKYNCEGCQTGFETEEDMRDHFKQKVCHLVQFVES